MKLIFFGTSQFAIPSLKSLKEAGHDIIAVITMPDQPAGRKKVMTAPPVKLAAAQLGIHIAQPESLKDDNFFNTFSTWQPDLGVVAAYGKIIPQRYLDISKHGFLNIHPSLLPKYRGPSPVQTAILNGDTETGVTIIKVDAQMDHGPILTNKELGIMNTEYYTELHDKLAQLGAELLIEAIPKYISGELKPQPQDDSQATICKMLTREDGKIDWSRPALEIYNQIRALNPEPGTWMMWKDKIINIKKAELRDGKLHIITLQMEGKKEMSFEEFSRGYPDFKISDLK